MTKYSIYKKKIMEDPRSEKINFKTDGRVYYVYRISDIEDKKHYYGYHIQVLDDIIEDLKSYGTSGKKKKLILENKDRFKFKIIKIFKSPGDAIMFESFLHQYFDVKNHNKFFNYSNQTPFGFDTSGRCNYINELGNIENILISDALDRGLEAHNKGSNHVFFGKNRPEHSKKMMGVSNPSSYFEGLRVNNYKTKETLFISKEDYYNEKFFKRDIVKRMAQGKINRGTWGIYSYKEGNKILKDRVTQRTKAATKTMEINNKMRKNKEKLDYIGDKVMFITNRKKLKIFYFNKDNFINQVDELGLSMTFIKQVINKERVYHKNLIFSFNEEDLRKRFIEANKPKKQPSKARKGKDNPNSKKYKITKGDFEVISHGNFKKILLENNIEPNFKKVGDYFLNSQGYKRIEIE